MLSIADALQLMLLFGTLIINLIALVVELIKNHQQKNILSLVMNHDPTGL